MLAPTSFQLIQNKIPQAVRDVAEYHHACQQLDQVEAQLDGIAKAGEAIKLLVPCA